MEVKDTVPAETGRIQAGSVVAALPGSVGGGDDSSSSTSSESSGGGGGGACFIATALHDLFGL